MMVLWRRREKLFHKRFDIVCVCSEKDKQLLSNSDRACGVGNGFEVTSLGLPEKHEFISGPVLGFIGNLDYPPNRAGIRWFIEPVLLAIKTRAPGVRLRMVGTGTNTEIGRNTNGIDGLGWITDTAEEMGSWSAMIVPILKGGGTRIKILEAFARRCPVISASIGAYGYDLEDDEEITIADDPVLFTRACIKLLTDKVICKRLIANAYNRYIQDWTWEAQAYKVEEAVNKCLERYYV